MKSIAILLAMAMVIEISKADPASITYASCCPNMYGQPMIVTVPSWLGTEAGLVATARRLARDNAEYPLVKIPVEIYVNGTPKEAAEYWHHGRVHEIRLNDAKGYVYKAIKIQ